MRPLSRRRMVGLLAISAVVVLSACGGGESSEQASTTQPEGPTRSVASGRAQAAHRILTEAEAEADAGQVIVVPYFFHDIGMPDQKGTELRLSGDDASTLRWRFAQKPDPFYLEWAKVDGQAAFETDGLIGDPTTATKLLEFRGVVDTSRTEDSEQTIIVELVEQNPADRSGEPAKRLEFTVEVMVPKECCRIQFAGP